MANEGKDDYQPDPKKIEAFETLSRQVQRGEEGITYGTHTQTNQGGNGNGNGKGNNKDRDRETENESELISVAAAIRRSDGRVTVPGMIIGVSTVVQMTMQTKIRCSQCNWLMAISNILLRSSQCQHS
jgi:hypothetical protein